VKWKYSKIIFNEPLKNGFVYLLLTLVATAAGFSVKNFFLVQH